MLALRGLMRVRNLAQILAPALVLGAIALTLDGRVPAAASGGALAVAMAPAPLFGPGIAGRMRGRADLAGALVLGTVLLSLGLAASRAALLPSALLAAAEAYGVAAIIANALPTVRDTLVVPIRAAGIAACGVVVALMAVTLPPIDLATVAVALGLVVAGAGSAALVARIHRRDVRAAICGAGLRDPALAGALAYLAAGPEALGVPVVYAMTMAVVAPIALRRSVRSG